MNTPQNLNQSINYQPNSVVSREILNLPTGTITLFAFDQDQGLSEHTAPFDALVQITDGVAQITVAGQPHQVKEGEILLLPANSPHALKAIKPFKMILTMIKSV